MSQNGYGRTFIIFIILIIIMLLLMLMLMSLFVDDHYVCSSVAGWPPGLEKLGRPRKIQVMLLLMLLMLMLLML